MHIEGSFVRERIFHGQGRHPHSARQAVPRHLRQPAQPEERKGAQEAPRGEGAAPTAGGGLRVSLVLLGAALLGALPGAAQQDRWQITLRDGAVLWELQLVRLDGDTVVFQHGDSTLRLHLLQVDEGRLVRASVRQITPEAGPYGGVPEGPKDGGYSPHPPRL